MLKAISVETGLNDIKDHLTNCGFEVVDMAECIRPIEAVVFTGELMSREHAIRMAKGTMLINASGLNGEQVAAQIEAKMGGYS